MVGLADRTRRLVARACEPAARMVGVTAVPTAPTPAVVVATRLALQQVAVHVLARRRHAVTGRFGLRPSPGGLATPAFGDHGEVVRTSGANLVVERLGDAWVEPLTTLGRAADLVGVDLAAPFWVGDDAPALADPSAPLAIDQDAAQVLADWWIRGATLLDQVAAGPGPAPGGPAGATVAQLWPEHFDHACVLTVATSDAASVTVTVGASPGDAYEPLPYLYVGPHGPERPGDPRYWNAPFGAVLRRDDVAEVPGAEGRARALAFLRRGLAAVAAG